MAKFDPLLRESAGSLAIKQLKSNIYCRCSSLLLIQSHKPSNHTSNIY
jgi:hypothetical protein